MPTLAHVAIHPSQYPEAVRAELLESLRSRRVNHKFHYDSVKQTQKWLALHQAFSPSRTDPECSAMYQRSFAAVVPDLPAEARLIGLGCGGGQKDTALLGQINASGRTASYTPCDVGVAMVLVARNAALTVVPGTKCFPLVCDLATANDLSAAFDQVSSAGFEKRNSRAAQEAQVGAAVQGSEPARLFTFFGMLPNFEPDLILPKIAGLMRRDDRLLLSANLAPGSDYRAGVNRVLPLYDNDLTRDWLLTFLLDLGVEKGDGELLFSIEEGASDLHLQRIAAHFYFGRDRIVEVDSHRFEFPTGDSVRLFFSYRHTPALVRSMASKYSLTVLGQWITPSEEEGVFLIKAETGTA